MSNTTATPVLSDTSLGEPSTNFLGRTEELDKLQDAFTEVPILLINGRSGTGKTRLASQFAKQVAASTDVQVAWISCFPNDLEVSLVARCERAMHAAIGEFDTVLKTEARLCIIDDVDRLPTLELNQFIRRVVRSIDMARVLFLSSNSISLPVDSRSFGIFLQGLDRNSGQQYWEYLQQTFGSCATEVSDVLEKTQCIPFALRQEFATARLGSASWELSSLSPIQRSVLETIAVARLPIAASGIRFVLKETDIQSALQHLCLGQWIDRKVDARYAIHELIRTRVLSAMEPSTRVAVQAVCAKLIRESNLHSVHSAPSTSGDDTPKDTEWQLGGVLPLEIEHRIDCYREICMHEIACEDFTGALATLEEFSKQDLVSGAAGEILSLINVLHESEIEDPALTKMTAQIAVQHGMYAEALEFHEVLDEVTYAYLLFRSGEVAEANLTLSELCTRDGETAALAASALCEVELTCGRPDSAENIVALAGRARKISPGTRTLLHLAKAEIEMHKSNLSGARTALARASRCADTVELTARVQVKRVRNLVEEQRFSEAAKQKEEVEALMVHLDCMSLRNELTRCEALVESRVGSAKSAAEKLRRVGMSARQRGDEIGALRADVTLAEVLVSAGELTEASEIISVVEHATAVLGLDVLSIEARLLSVRVALMELRVDMASEQLAGIDTELLSHQGRRVARVMAREIAARRGEKSTEGAESSMEAVGLALAVGDTAKALQAARRVAVDAERLGHPGALSRGLAVVARLELARGHRERAEAAASRAARESKSSACISPQIQSLLVLAALARDRGDVRQAAIYASDAKHLADAAGLPVHKYIAIQAMEVISRDTEDLGSSIPNPAGANISAQGAAVSEAMLADLGFSITRPYRCVDARGIESFVASASPELLSMDERSLVVDAIRQLVLRNGETIADVRRRSLLKRMLFLFASHPLRGLSKQEIVEAVWQVEYHPLRHDAALFTNIMRIRRLLGDDGTELISVSEEGYSFVPPRDYLFVDEPV